jgi:hypothetical protein
VQAKLIKLVGLKNGGRLSPINLVTFAGTQNGELKNLLLSWICFTRLNGKIIINKTFYDAVVLLRLILIKTYILQLQQIIFEKTTTEFL